MMLILYRYIVNTIQRCARLAKDWWNPIPVIEYYSEYGYTLEKEEGNAGYDLNIHSTKEVMAERGRVLGSTGIHLNPNAEDIYYTVAARSSIFTKLPFLFGLQGTVDSSYSGEIMVGLVADSRCGASCFESSNHNLYNICKSSFDALKEYTGRCAQLIPSRPVRFVRVESKDCFTKTTRGDKGFGSTGN